MSRESEPAARTANDEVGFRYGEEAVSEFSRFSELGRKEDVEIAGHVLAWAATRDLRVRWGSGHNDGSFAIVLDVGGQSYWLFTVWAIGTIDVQFAMLMAHAPFSDESLRKELAERLERVPNVKIGEEGLTGRPSLLLAALEQPDDLRTFTDALEWAVAAIRQPNKPSSTPPDGPTIRMSSSVQDRLQDEGSNPT